MQAGCAARDSCAPFRVRRLDAPMGSGRPGACWFEYPKIHFDLPEEDRKLMAPLDRSLRAGNRSRISGHSLDEPGLAFQKLCQATALDKANAGRMRGTGFLRTLSSAMGSGRPGACWFEYPKINFDLPKEDRKLMAPLDRSLVPGIEVAISGQATASQASPYESGARPPHSKWRTGTPWSNAARLSQVRKFGSMNRANQFDDTYASA